MGRFVVVFTFITLFITQIEAKKFPGYFVTKSHEKVEVDFDVRANAFSGEIKYGKIQNKIKYFDSNNKKHTLRPDMALELVIDVYGDPIRFLSRANNLGLGSFFSGKNIFLRIMKDGRLKLFKVYETRSTPGYYNASTNMVVGGTAKTVEKHVLQKDNGELFKTSLITFKKDMARYLSDCPDLISKIENKQLRMQDMAQIVNEYNMNCR